MAELHLPTLSNWARVLAIAHFLSEILFCPRVTYILSLELLSRASKSHHSGVFALVEILCSSVGTVSVAAGLISFALNRNRISGILLIIAWSLG
jgi:predicted membrane-bound spermidine synthase